MTRLDMDLKVMPTFYKGHKFLLINIDEVANNVVNIPIHQPRSEEIGEALVEHVSSNYSIPEFMIMDEVSAFMPTLICYLFKMLGTKFKIFIPYYPSFFTGRTWNYVLSYYTYETFNRKELVDSLEQNIGC